MGVEPPLQWMPLPQVMNMYGDLVMDTVPDKVSGWPGAGRGRQPRCLGSLLGWVLGGSLDTWVLWKGES